MNTTTTTASRINIHVPPVEGIDAPPVDTTKTNGVQAMIAMRYRISGDIVNEATKDLPDDQRSELRWLHAYGATNNLTPEELGAMLKKPNGEAYSKDSVYQTLTGRRNDSGVSVKQFCEAVTRTRKLVEARASVKRAPFIETSLTRKIWKFCEGALNFQRIGFLYSSSQVGKSTALEAYAIAHNHGQTIYVRMPALGQYGDFLRCLAIALRISPNLKGWQLKDRIISAFDDKMLLIIDQAHECFRSRYSEKPLGSLLFAMEIFDRKKCGVVIAGTTDLENGMKDTRHQDTMVQLTKRGFPKCMPRGPISTCRSCAIGCSNFEGNGF